MYTLIEVTTRQHETDFLELPVRLYKGNPWWIRPLDNDIRNVFDPAKILVSKMANVSAGF